MSSRELDLSLAPALQERKSRRAFLRGSAILGAMTMSLAAGEAAFPILKQAYEKYESIGNDYSNDDFVRLVGAHDPGFARLKDILHEASDEPIDSFRHGKLPSGTESIAEYTLFARQSGPVHIETEAIEADEPSLNVLKVVVDDESFLLPIVAGPSKETPVTIQLGVRTRGEHRVVLSGATDKLSVSAEDIRIGFVSSDPGTLRSVIDSHQPDMYLRNYGNIGHNIPLSSHAFIYEQAESLALVYWIECLGEDLEYGYFGTSVEKLIRTKNRPTDFDWVLEALVSKETGKLTEANIAIPYHTRMPFDIPDSYTCHPPLREASPNNNVRSITNSDMLSMPKFRPRPRLTVHQDRRSVLYNTGRDTALLSLREHQRRGDVDLNSPVIKAYLGSLGLDAYALNGS